MVRVDRQTGKSLDDWLALAPLYAIARLCIRIVLPRDLACVQPQLLKDPRKYPQVRHLIKSILPQLQRSRKPLPTYAAYVAPKLPTTALEQIQYCRCHTAEARRNN